MKTLTKILKKLDWFEWLLVLLVLLPQLYVAVFAADVTFPRNWFTRDDSFYYYKVAQNISEGYGSTFDGINPTNGYHPLWMLICIPIFALARFDLILPLRILLLVMAVLGAVTSVALGRFVTRNTSQIIGRLAAAFWAFDLNNLAVINQNGMETGILALSVVLFLSLLQDYETRQRAGQATPKDLLLLGLAAAFALFSRLDTVYLVLLGGIWVVFRNTPLRYLLILDLFTSLAVIVTSYYLRAGKAYVVTFSHSAVLVSLLAVAVHVLVFYFAGLYNHPRSMTARQLLQQTILGAGLVSLLVGATIFGLGFAGLIELPRAVPFYYALGLIGFGLAGRFLVRGLSANQQPMAFSPLPFFRQNWPAWLKDASVYFSIPGIGLVLYWLLNLAIVGTPMPVSGQIKRWWGSLPYNIYGNIPRSAEDLFGLDPVKPQSWYLLTTPITTWASQIQSIFRETDATVMYWLLLAVVVVIYMAFFLSNRQRSLSFWFGGGIFILLFSAELQVLVFGAMGYAASHEWYWTMASLVLVLLGAHLLDQAIRIVPGATFGRLASIAVFLAGAWWAYQFAFYVTQRMPTRMAEPLPPMQDELPLIENFTQPGDIIGMTGGGSIGYFIKDRTIVNMDGLINSYDYYKAQREERAGEFLADMGMSYVFANETVLLDTEPYIYNMKGRLEDIPGMQSYGEKRLMRFLQTPLP